MLVIRRAPELTFRLLAAQTNCTARKFSRDYDSSDDEKDSPKKKLPNEKQTIKEDASSRLNSLLASMQKEDTNFNLVKEVAIARPGDASKKRKEVAKQAAEAKDVVAAAKRVAELLGGDDKKQTESELLMKLLGRNHEIPEAVTDEKTATNDVSLSDLIVGMKIDRTQKHQDVKRSEFVRRAVADKTQYTQTSGVHKYKERKRESAAYTGSVNLFGSTPLGIFKNPDELRESPDILNTWEHLYRHELNLQVTHPPANYFEKVAQWTEQGKLWRFPIDNEQDWQDEIDVDFTEHIFLEQHLEGWCPSKGPVRHFMELVCVGLSKNPYITAKEKKDHILWYRDYFEAKKDILKDLMKDKEMNKSRAVNSVTS